MTAEPIDIGPAYDDTAAAMQAEMLQIDVAYGQSWIRTMRELVDEQLPPLEFTRRRMEALKSWTRLRKRAQAQLRWKYDRSGRRRRELVDRDVKRALAHARRVLEEDPPPTEQPPAQGRTDRTMRERRRDLAAALMRTAEPTPLAPARPAFVRSLENVDPVAIEVIMRDTGFTDLTTRTDDEIRQNYIDRGLTAEVADTYLSFLAPNT